jgi:predicted  nucleic acid-binding Zn-ribbon protein
MKLLETLQKVDLELQETEQSLAALPQKLQALRDNLTKVVSLLDGERQRFEEAVGYRSQLETNARVAQDELTKAKTRLQQVRNSKEYMAAQREFDTNRKVTGERESEIGKLAEAIEQFKQSIDAKESELATLREHVAEEEKATSEKLERLRGQALQQRIDRDVMSEKVAPAVLRKYQQIRRQRGLAVVEARSGVCSGCHMQLPPQLFNILHRGNSIELCPNCQRIVYFPEESTSSA